MAQTSSANRPIVYSLLAVVFVLLLGIMTMLWIASSRQQRLEDATLDLQRNMGAQKDQIDQLHKRLEDCNQADARSVTPVDTSWNQPPVETTRNQTVSRDTKPPDW